MRDLSLKVHDVVIEEFLLVLENGNVFIPDPFGFFLDAVPEGKV